MKLIKIFFSPINVWLGVSIIFSIFLLVVRQKITGSYHFIFLIWNIFLAGIPLVFSIVLNPNYALENLLRLEIAAKYTALLLFEV